MDPKPQDEELPDFDEEFQIDEDDEGLEDSDEDDLLEELGL